MTLEEIEKVVKFTYISSRNNKDAYSEFITVLVKLFNKYNTYQ